MPLHLHTHIPSLDGITEWLNAEPEILEHGDSPLLIYFWATSCHVCHATMPKLQAWREKFVPRGLKMVAIHCPRMQSDTNIEKVKEAITEFGIVEPCGVDNKHKAKKSFENEIWPAFFLFDEDRNLVRRAAGLSGLSMLEPIAEEMLEK